MSEAHEERLRRRLRLDASPTVTVRMTPRALEQMIEIASDSSDGAEVCAAMFGSRLSFGFIDVTSVLYATRARGSGWAKPDLDEIRRELGWRDDPLCVAAGSMHTHPRPIPEQRHLTCRPSPADISFFSRWLDWADLDVAAHVIVGEPDEGSQWRDGLVKAYVARRVRHDGFLYASDVVIEPAKFEVRRGR